MAAIQNLEPVRDTKPSNWGPSITLALDTAPYPASNHFFWAILGPQIGNTLILSRTGPLPRTGHGIIFIEPRISFIQISPFADHDPWSRANRSSALAAATAAVDPVRRDRRWRH